MKFSQSFRVSNDKVIKLVAAACLLGSALAHATVTYLQEDFQEATLGGTWTAPSGPDTTGVSPTPAPAYAAFGGGGGFVVAGGINSSKGIDAVKRDSLGANYLEFVPSVQMASGVWQSDFLFHDVNVPLGNPALIIRIYDGGIGNPTAWQWQQTAGDTFQLIDGLHVVASGMSNDVPYRFQLQFDEVSGAYNMTVVRLTDNGLIGSYQGAPGSLSPGNGLAGLFDWDPAGFATATGGTEYIRLDNVLIVDQVPEPSTVVLFGIGGGLLWLRRRTQRRSA